MTSRRPRTTEPPRSPFSNLAATARTGSTKSGSAIWRLACACGHELEADAQAIKRGGAYCPTCNPRYGQLEAQRILDVLPATFAQIVKRTGMSEQAVKYRLRLMKRSLCHAGDWKRSSGAGAFQPVFVAGEGEDVPCPLKRRTVAQVSRRYRKRVKKAVEKALSRGEHDGRYARHVGLAKANITAAKTRAAPQTWLSALMQ